MLSSEYGHCPQNKQIIGLRYLVQVFVYTYTKDIQLVKAVYIYLYAQNLCLFVSFSFFSASVENCCSACPSTFQ